MHATSSTNKQLQIHSQAGSNDDGGYHAGHLSCDTFQHPTRGLLLAAAGATGGVLVWDSCCEPMPANEETAVGGPRPTADLRNNGHEYGIPVTQLAAYPDGSFFISADSTTLKVCRMLSNVSEPPWVVG